MKLSRGKEMIIDFEPWFFLHPAIRSAKIGKKIKSRFRCRLQIGAGSYDVFARNYRRNLAQRLDDLRNPFGMRRL
jgi:hypothetical protein